MKFLHSIVVALSLSLSIAATAMATVTPTASAFSISSSAVTQQDDGNALARVFTISGSQPVRKLRMGFVGRVFVDAARELRPVIKGESTSLAVRDAVAQVIITSDSRDLLEAVEVIEAPADVIKVRFNKDHVDLQGHVLTEIVTSHQNQLLELTASGASDVVLGDNVLVKHDDHAAVRLMVSGSGTIYVASGEETVSLDSLSLIVSGSGDIQVATRALTLVDTLSLLVSGSGTTAVVGNEITAGKSLESVVSGSGNVFVQADDQVTTHSLRSKVSGSGDITISRSGSCQAQTVEISGVGTIATGSMACEDTDVTLSGVGDVLVNTHNRLHVKKMAALLAEVKYVGATPTDIKLDHRLRRWEKLSDFITGTNSNEYTEYHEKELPSRMREFVDVRFSHWRDGDDEEEEEGGYDVDFEGKSWALSMATRISASGSHAWVLVTVVGVAFVSVGIAVHQFQQHRAREAYQPLL